MVEVTQTWTSCALVCGEVTNQGGVWICISFSESFTTFWCWRWNISKANIPSFCSVMYCSVSEDSCWFLSLFVLYLVYGSSKCVCVCVFSLWLHIYQWAAKQRWSPACTCILWLTHSVLIQYILLSLFLYDQYSEVIGDSVTCCLRAQCGYEDNISGSSLLT